MLSKFYSEKENILKKSQEFFQNSNFCSLKIGAELEFFLCDKNSQRLDNKALLDDFIFELDKKLKENFILFYEVEKERGAAQIEIKTIFTSDLSKLADELNNAKKFITKFAIKKDLKASFLAQPFAEDCGSALQFNISLHDEKDKNIFLSDEQTLENVASALLESTNAMMIFLAPQKEDYVRFSFAGNKDLFKRGKFTAPVNLSFGADNRTCAIRVVLAKEDQKIDGGKRLEYRIASASADPHLSLAAIILVICDGIKNKKPRLKQIFGNAFDEQYGLKNFCSDYAEAEEYFLKKENFIRSKFVEFFTI